MQNLEDAYDELLMVEDETMPIPYVVGEVFAHLQLEEAKVIPQYLILNQYKTIQISFN